MEDNWKGALQGVPLPLDILDTNFHFPDMRRLAISSASAFMLVFAVDDVQSFKEVIYSC